MKRPSLAFLHPGTWRPALQAARSLWFDYAHLRSVLTQSCVDRDGRPIPWYTYPAVEYVKQLDLRSARVFEYGAGNSTLFWASVAREVISVDDDEAWFTKLKPTLPANCALELETDLNRYSEVIHRHPGGFDVIVVDGAARGSTRLRCARNAMAHLRPGGMVILDNSDWLPESARTLRDADLIQVDMTGFVPIGGHTQTTSFFLHREFRWQPRGDRQPLPGPGALPNVWEHPRPTTQPLVEIGGETFGGVTSNEMFTFVTPEGARRFSLLVAHESLNGRGCVAILDQDQQRVLLALTQSSETNAAAVEAEFRAVLGSRWDAFCDYVDTHDKKRYRLRPYVAVA
jgi:hypothetical protein